MKEIIAYRRQELVITDEPPFDYPEGTWICHEAGGEWHVHVSHGGRLLYTHELKERLLSKEAAIGEAHRLIDLDLLELDAHEIGLRLPSNNPSSSANPTTQTQIVSTRLSSWPTATLPVRFVLNLHNATPVGSEIRRQFSELIAEIAHKDAKAHWTRAIQVLDNGDLAFDDTAFSKAVHRGKQETYASSAMDLLKRLERDLVSLRIHEMEEAAHAPVEGRKYLLPEATRSADVRTLREKWAIVTQVQEGLTGVAGISKASETIRSIGEMRSEISKLNPPA